MVTHIESKRKLMRKRLQYKKITKGENIRIEESQHGKKDKKEMQKKNRNQ